MARRSNNIQEFSGHGNVRDSEPQFQEGGAGGKILKADTSAKIRERSKDKNCGGQKPCTIC